MSNKSYDVLDFKNRKKLQKCLRESHLHSPNHKSIKIDPIYSDWQEFRDAKWIYNGFIDRVIDWLNNNEYYNPWIIEQTTNAEVHLSGYTEGPKFGADFNLYYNAVRVGSFQIDPEWDDPFTNEDNVENKKVDYYAFIECVDLIPFEDIANLHDFMNRHCRSVENKNLANSYFYKSALSILWNVRNDTDKEASLTLSGKALYSVDWLKGEKLI